MSHLIFKSILMNTGINPDLTLNTLTIEGHDPILPSPFLIGEAGAAALAAVGYAANELWFLKTKRRQKIQVHAYNAAIAQRSHQYLNVVDGKTEELWSSLSGFYQTQDQRWIQFHCNFLHHQQGVLDLLECSADKKAIACAVKNWQADILEQTLADNGMCAAIVRTASEWREHPQAQAIHELPLFEITKIGDSDPEPMPLGDRPLSGIRVLDLTRVLAGPVCGKMLAEQGATVMRIASPHLPFILPLVMDTGFGKLSAYIDLNNAEDALQLKNLIHQTDVFSQSYRPGGLASRGFSATELAKLRPGIIYVDLSAYSHLGPWADRHGYDSLIQSATGIADEQGHGKPQHLPAQSLDYLSGFLAAFATMEALRRRATEGGSYWIRLSLAQTAHWFTELGRTNKDYHHCEIPTRNQIQHLLTTTDTLFGRLEHLIPLLQMSETPPLLGRAVVPLGTDPAVWPSTVL